MDESCECPICRRSFDTAKGLKCHLTTQHGGKLAVSTSTQSTSTSNHLCVICRSEFKTAYGLKRHISTCQKFDVTSIKEYITYKSIGTLDQFKTLAETNKQLVAQTCEYADQIKSLETQLAYYQSKCDVVTEAWNRESKRLDIATAAASVPTTTHVTNKLVVVTDSLRPITYERIQEAITKLIEASETKDASITSNEHMLHGFMRYLHDAIMVSDKSRNTIIWKDGDLDNRIQKDQNAKGLARKVCEASRQNPISTLIDQKMQRNHEQMESMKAIASHASKMARLQLTAGGGGGGGSNEDQTEEDEEEPSDAIHESIMDAVSQASESVSKLGCEAMQFGQLKMLGQVEQVFKHVSKIAPTKTLVETKLVKQTLKSSSSSSSSLTSSSSSSSVHVLTDESGCLSSTSQFVPARKLLRYFFTTHAMDILFGSRERFLNMCVEECKTFYVYHELDMSFVPMYNEKHGTISRLQFLNIVQDELTNVFGVDQSHSMREKCMNQFLMSETMSPDHNTANFRSFDTWRKTLAE